MLVDIARPLNKGIEWKASGQRGAENVRQVSWKHQRVSARPLIPRVLPPRKMIKYTESVENITSDMLRGFFGAWKKPRTPNEHLEILKKSSHIVLAIDTDTGKVVGFVNALTDGMQPAFIPLLEVLTEYRRRGIGSAMVSRMLEKLKDIPAIDLTCDPTLQGFYSKFGMVFSSGMIIRKY